MSANGCITRQCCSGSVVVVNFKVTFLYVSGQLSKSGSDLTGAKS